MLLNWILAILLKDRLQFEFLFLWVVFASSIASFDMQELFCYIFCVLASFGGGRSEEYSLFKIKGNGDYNEWYVSKNFYSIECWINIHLCQPWLLSKRADRLKINETFHKLEMKPSAEMSKVASRHGFNLRFGWWSSLFSNPVFSPCFGKIHFPCVLTESIHSASHYINNVFYLFKAGW